MNIRRFRALHAAGATFAEIALSAAVIGARLAQIGIPTVYSFHMVLSHSRDPFCCFTTRMDLATFWDCHRRAFAHFGGYVGVIPTNSSGGRSGWQCSSRSAHVLAAVLVRQRDAAEELGVTLGHPLVDDYLEFVAARCRVNTLLGTAYDLKVFFSLVPKEPTAVPYHGNR